jgi:AP endonuclease-1
MLAELHGYHCMVLHNVYDRYEATIEAFDKTVGLSYLRAIHLNDSKGPLGCHADRHEKIGKGAIGLEPFRYLMNDARLNDIPMILETPFVDDAGYEAEISLLYSLCREDKANAISS